MNFQLTTEISRSLYIPLLVVIPGSNGGQTIPSPDPDPPLPDPLPDPSKNRLRSYHILETQAQKLPKCTACTNDSSQEIINNAVRYTFPSDVDKKIV